MSIGLTILLYFLLFLRFVLWAYSIVILVYAILSWFPVDADNFLVKFIRGLVDPIYEWLLSFLPPLRLGMIDFSLLYLIGINYLLLKLIEGILKGMIKVIS